MRVFARTPINIAEVKLPLGEVYLIPERCKGCNLCIHFCPKQVLEESTGTNAKGYHYPEIISGREEDCVNCEFCTMVCPEFAIYTLEVEQ
ncbi:MAG: 4Fe-4S binding protein [Anaerolineales bacterium]|nr:4Fe-4S binding protein [Anaerolineales bacterium]